MERWRHEFINPSEKLLSWVYLHENSDVDWIPPHWHRGIELSYTIAGKIDQFTIGDEVFKTSPGTILVVNSQEVHSIRVHKNQHVKEEAFTITYPYSFVLSQFSDLAAYECCINHTETFSSEQHQQYALLQNKLELLVAYYKKSHSFSTIKMNILLLEILSILLEYFLVKREQKTLKSKLEVAERIQVMNQYIHEHYTEVVGLDELAEVCHLSKSYMARFFKRYMDATVGEYINTVRAHKAKEDLLETSLSFTSIAIKNGFSGLRSMNRALEKEFLQNARAIRLEQRRK